MCPDKAYKFVAFNFNCVTERLWIHEYYKKIPPYNTELQIWKLFFGLTKAYIQY